MSRGRTAEFKPLSFSTTMRNPERIAAFLKCLSVFKGQILDNHIIFEVVKLLIREKLYCPMYVKRNVFLHNIFKSEENFSEGQIDEIIENSPQDHKEAGFDKGWPSRFDTFYKLPMELGFVYYKINEPIIVSQTGTLLIDAYKSQEVDNEQIKNVFLNALMKYQTNNPFRKILNSNVPLILLLETIKLLKEDKEENGAGILRNELSLLICWQNNNAYELYNLIKKLRKKYRYNCSDDIIYKICLNLLLENDTKESNRFKKKQILGESVDDFIRKMRITGIISLRGNGRFIDFNAFESGKIEYILTNYVHYDSFVNKKEFFDYMSKVDSNIICSSQDIDNKIVEDIKLQTLLRWANEYSIKDIANELLILAKKRATQNNVLKFIDEPTRLEFLVSVILVQHFKDAKIYPNYHVDDEGIPTFTASGGMADIEYYDKRCKSLVEVTLMTSRNQSIVEIPAITRHLQEEIKKESKHLIFSVFIAPVIHADSKYMSEFSKSRYQVTILPYDIEGFISNIKNKTSLSDLLVS